jgi:hypothetical protein
MFGLTLVDHLRLTFGHVIYSHRAHSQLAERHARWNRWLRGGELLLMLSTALASVALLTTGEMAYAIATAVAAVLAVCLLAARLVFDFDASESAHRSCSARLWHIREQYRALLADLKDGALTLEGARERRDALMLTLQDVYENAPPADRAAYQSARQAIPADHEAVLADEEVDRFLPPSLQKGGTTAA